MEQILTSKDLLRCGPSSLQFCAAMSGRPLEADEIEKHIQEQSEEHSLAEVNRVARSLGLRTVAVRWTGALPPAGAAPAIIRIVTSAGKSHFVSLAGCWDDRALIVDLPGAAVWMTEAQLRHKLQWSGDALHIAASDAALASIRMSAASTSRWKGGALGLAATAGVIAMLIVVAAWRPRSLKSAIVK